MSDEEHDPEFGPGGYLPGKAAKRARKIVLRAELGVQWVIASIVAALVVLVAGVVWFGSRDAVPEGYLAVVDTRSVADADDSHVAFGVLVLNDGGRLRVFEQVDPTLVWCAATRQLEAEVDGEVRIWSSTGRALTGGPGIPQHPFVVTKGAVWVDRDTLLPAPSGRDEGVATGCI